MKTITIMDNDTRESLVITTDAYVLAHVVSGTIVKVEGQLSFDTLMPFIKKRAIEIFMSTFKGS